MAFAIIPIWNTGLSGVWNKTDLGFPLNPISDLSSSVYVWNRFFLGWDVTASDTLRQLPAASFLAALNSLGLGVGQVERIFFVILFFAMGSGASLLFRELFLDYQSRRAGSIVAAFAYIYNPATILRVFGGDGPWLVAMAALPFGFLFFVKGMKLARESVWASMKYAILTAFASALILASSPPLALLVLLFFGFYGILEVLRSVGINRTAVVGQVSFVLASIVVSIVANSWWLFSLLYSALNAGPVSSVVASLNANSTAVGGFGAVVRSLGLESNSTLPVQALRLQTFGIPSLGMPRFVPSYWAFWMDSTILNTLTPFFFALTMLPLILKPTDSRNLFLTTVNVISIAALMGFATDIGQAWLWLMYHSALFATLTTFDKIGPIASISSSLLVGLSITVVIDSERLRKTNKLVRRSSKAVLLVFVCGFIVLNSFPLMTGNLSGVLQPMPVPGYYYQADDWLASQPGNFRSLVLPNTGSLELYKWFPNYDTVDIATNLFSAPVIANRPLWDLSSYPVRFTASVDKAIGGLNSTSAAKLLSFLDVKYIVVKGDLLPDNLYNGSRVSLFDNFSSSSSYTGAISSAAIMGNLSVYENNLVGASDLIYATTNVPIFKGAPSDFDALTSFIASHGLSAPHSAIVASWQLNDSNTVSKIEHLSPVSSAQSSVSWTAVNPTEYKVNMTSRSPILLVFDEAYSTSWRATVSGGPEDTLTHVVVNGYANGWIVQQTGNYTIDLYYAPQTVFLIGSALSLGFLVVSFSFLVIPGLIKWSLERKPNPADSHAS